MLGVWMINMLGFFKKLAKKLDGNWIDKDPVRHYFPDVGSDGEITIDCVITPSPGANRNMPTGNEELYDWREGVASKCVGALVVEVDEYGLRLRWKPGKLGEDGFLSPFAPAPGMKPPAKPTEQRGGDGNVKPLEHAEVDVQAGTPNVGGKRPPERAVRRVPNGAAVGRSA